MYDQIKREDWAWAVDALALAGIQFDRGLSDAEVEAAERETGFRFPPDLRALLQTALPRGPKFPQWRAPESPEVRRVLAWPREGLCFDVEHNGLWLADWGQRPARLEEALRVAAERVDAAPKLVPIYVHRYLPSEPPLAGNPVFSVHQSDIIYYGHDLADYLANEFQIPRREARPPMPRKVRFWSAMVQ